AHDHVLVGIRNELHDTTKMAIALGGTGTVLVDNSDSACYTISSPRNDAARHSTFSSAYTPHSLCCSIQPSKPLPITRHQPLVHFLTRATTPTCRRAAIALVGSGRSYSDASSSLLFMVTTAVRRPDSSE